MKKLLIGGNDSLFRSKLMKLVESNSFFVKEASRTNEVLKCVCSEKFDAVIFNFGFDDVDSTQAFFAMRVVDKELPVIVISNENDTLSSVAPVIHEAYRYYSMPVDLKEINEAVNEAIDARADSLI